MRLELTTSTSVAGEVAAISVTRFEEIFLIRTHRLLLQELKPEYHNEDDAEHFPPVCIQNVVPDVSLPHVSAVGRTLLLGFPTSMVDSRSVKEVIFAATEFLGVIYGES